MSEDAMLALLTQANGIVRLIGSYFPPALWAVNAVTMTGTNSLINWGLYLLSALGAFAIAYFVGSKLYLSGALAQLETAKRGKKARLDTKKLSSGSPMRAMALRELKLNIRSPIYSLNSLIGVVLFPAMIFIMPMFSASDPDLQAISDAMISVPQSMIFIIGLGIGIFICMTNLAAGTVLSREGDSFWLSKVIPVPYRTQAFGKLIFAWSIDAATIVLGVVSALFLFSDYIGQILLSGICALVAAVSLTAISMMIDIARPKLKCRAKRKR
jgi:ABC-2 type transport system permease protein